MAEFGNWFVTSIGAIIVSVVTYILKDLIDHGKRWKTKREQFDDLISKTQSYNQGINSPGVERAHLENSIFAKFGWPMPVEAVQFLISKENFPSNLEIFHKSRRNIAFINGAFHNTRSRVANLIAAPTDNYIRVYEQIGISLTLSWGFTTAVLLFTNFGFKIFTLHLNALWIIATPPVLFFIYLLGTSLTNMRRERALLTLNNS